MKSKIRMVVELTVEVKRDSWRVTQDDACQNLSDIVEEAIALQRVTEGTEGWVSAQSIEVVAELVKDDDDRQADEIDAFYGYGEQE